MNKFITIIFLCFYYLCDAQEKGSSASLYYDFVQKHYVLQKWESPNSDSKKLVNPSKKDLASVVNLTISLDTLPQGDFYAILKLMPALTEVYIEDPGNIYGATDLLTDSLVSILSEKQKLSSLKINLTGNSGDGRKNGGFYIPAKISKLKHLAVLEISSSDYLNVLISKKNDTLKLPDHLSNLKLSALSAKSPYVKFDNCGRLKKLDLTFLIDNVSVSDRHSPLDLNGVEEFIYNSFNLSDSSEKYPAQSVKMNNARLCLINDRIKNHVLSLDHSMPFKSIDINPLEDFSYRFAIKLDFTSTIFIKNIFLLKSTSVTGNTKLVSEGHLGKLSSFHFNVVPEGDSAAVDLSLLSTGLFNLTIAPETSGKQLVTIGISGDSLANLSLLNTTSRIKYKFTGLPSYISRVIIKEVDKEPGSSEGMFSVIDQLSKTEVNIVVVPLSCLELFETDPGVSARWKQVAFSAEKINSGVTDSSLSDRIIKLNKRSKTQFSVSR